MDTTRTGLAAPHARNFSDVITVTVGSGTDQKTFVVHGNLISADSSLFKAAFSRNWLEAISKSVPLPGERPAHFQTFLSWLYSDTADEERAATNLTNAARSLYSTVAADETMFEVVFGDTAMVRGLCYFWMHGEYLGAKGFQNAAMRALLDQNIYLIPGLVRDQSFVGEIFDGTEARAPLRTWFMDAAATTLQDREMEVAGEWPQDFTIGLLTRLAVIREQHQDSPKVGELREYLR